MLPPRSALSMHGAARYAWQVCACMHRYIDAYTCMHTYKCMPARCRTHTRTHQHTHTHTHTPTHTHTHPHTHTHTHPRTHPQHGIANRKTDVVDGRESARGRRVSLTFRAVRHTDAGCACAFPRHCDSQQATIPVSRKDWETAATTLGGGSGGGASLSREKLREMVGGDEEAGERVAGPIVMAAEEDDEGGAVEAPEIERRHVHEVYDAIAPHFSATRYKAWPRVQAFLDSLEPGSLVADLGVCVCVFVCVCVCV